MMAVQFFPELSVFPCLFCFSNRVRSHGFTEYMGGDGHHPFQRSRADSACVNQGDGTAVGMADQKVIPNAGLLDDPGQNPKAFFMHEEGLGVLPRVIEQAGIRDHFLIGHSDGGSIALIYAGGIRPASLKGVVSIAAHVFCEPVTADSIRKAKEAWENGQLRKKLYRHHMENTETAFKGWNDVWLDPAFMEWNIEEFLSKIEVPVLAVQGEDDPYGTRPQMDTISAKSPGPDRSFLIPGCGHAPHIEKKRILLDLVSGFVRNPLAPHIDNSCNF